MGKFTSFLWAALGVVAFSGCARPAPICPVSGLVLVNGQPANGAYVVFHAMDDPKREQNPDTARTQPDGSFTARVRGPGEYAVTVFWPRVTKEQEEIIEGEDQLNGKYRNPAQPVLRTSIRDGENSLPPIRLTYP